ncbi:MAG: hypothetical protein FWD59_04890, partial [Micrococcales bacterium]|nr:hypothetical protein [Micrococcales bacterium]
MSRTHRRTLSLSFAALAAFSLAIGGGLAAQSTGTNPPDHGEAYLPSSSVVDDFAYVEVTGQIAQFTDVPLGEPDMFIHTETGVSVPIDRPSLPTDVSPGQTVGATVLVPVAAFEDASPELAEQLAEQLEQDDGGWPDTLDAREGAGQALVQAAADADFALEVAELEVLAEAETYAADATPHWIDIAFLSADGRGRFVSEADMARYIGSLSEWWARETKGAIPAFQYSYADSRAGRTSAPCVSLANGAFDEAAQLFGEEDYWGYMFGLQRHLLVLSPADENGVNGCSAGYSGVASLGYDVTSGGVTHIVFGNVAASTGVVIHEFGHHFGLLHAGSATCPEGVVDGPIDSEGKQICTCATTAEVYGDLRNVMGGAMQWETSGLSGRQKVMLGVLRFGDPLLEVIEDSGVFDVTLKDNAQTQGLGVEALRIREKSGSSTSEYYVEYDSRAGGVAIRHTNASGDASLIQGLDEDIFVLTPGGSNPGAGQRWMVGQTMTSVHGGLTVRVDQTSVGVARVHVELDQSRPWVRVSRSFLRVDEGGPLGASVVTTGQGSWTATSDVAWLTPTASGVSGQTLMASVAANPSGEMRAGVITVRSAGASAMIRVHQGSLGLPVTFSPAYLSVDGAMSVGSVAVTTREEEWTARSDDSWLYVPDLPGVSGGRLYVLAYENPGPARSGTVTVTSGAYSGTLQVTQPAVGTTLAVSASGWQATSNAASVNVTVTTNRPSWSASSNQPWLSASPSSGVSGGQLTVSLQQNTTAFSREGEVRVTADGKGYTFRVVQAARPFVSVSQTQWSPGAAASALMVMARTNQPLWTATSNQPWLTVSSPSGLSGDGLTVSVTPHVGAPRQGTVTVSALGVSTTLTVTQGEEAQSALATS